MHIVVSRKTGKLVSGQKEASQRKERKRVGQVGEAVVGRIQHLEARERETRHEGSTLSRFSLTLRKRSEEKEANQAGTEASKLSEKKA